MHDKQNKPIENAVFWTEYVIRHKGAPHLKVAGVHLPLYKYLLLDVYFFLILIIVVVVYLLFFLCKLLYYKNKSAKFKQVVKKNK